ncbi:alcohol dehydrogenase catalytic domain-containing protein [Streptomyces sp. NPDC057072]|uniref:alcohol dehydrogenase catalytic domain-containing protein n=1 Tax=Streptomyces sp. NPDC057072 TaxID=3346014 RepID=UPI0036250111
MKQTVKTPEAFLGVGYTHDRAGLPLEAVRIPVAQPAAGQVLIRVAASSLNPLEYKLAELNFMGRTPPVGLGLDLAGVVVAVGHGVGDVTVGDAVAALADLDGDGGWVASGGGEGGYALAHRFLTARKPPSLSFLDAAALPMCFLSAFAGLHKAVQTGDTVYVPGGGAASGIWPCRWQRVRWAPEWSSAAAVRRNPSHWHGSPAPSTSSTTSTTTSRPT